MILGATLLIMSGITLFSLLFEMTFYGSILNFEIEGLSALNGTSTQFNMPTTSSDFFIAPVEGGIVILTTVIFLAGVAGIQILGSGLSDNSHRIIMICSIYIGVWAILSVIALPLIWAIELFGGLIYISLTLGYVFGIIQKISEG